MHLREGTLHTASFMLCAGCGQQIDGAQRYLTLQLDNLDGTLQPADYACSHFHNEHCVAEIVRHGQQIAPAITTEESTP